MALDTEVHTEVFVNSTDADWILYAIWQHLGGVGAGNGVIRIANDGVNNAIKTGGVLGAEPSVVTDFVTDDFICIEPVEQYPGGGRWQCLIFRGTTPQMKYILAPDGGWDSVAYGAPAPGNNYGFGSGVNPDPVITTNPHPEAYDGGLTSTGSIRLSSCNRDTYNAGANFYSYFRFLIKSAGADASLEGFRVGGYIPVDSTNDTKPVCALGRVASIGDVSDYWGYDTISTTLNHNRTPLEYGHVSQLSNAGYAAVKIDGDLIGTGTDRSGQIFTLAPGLVALDDAKFLGVFGIYDMREIDPLIPDGTISGYPIGYFTADEVLFRWAP